MKEQSAFVIKAWIWLLLAGVLAIAAVVFHYIGIKQEYLYSIIHVEHLVRWVFVIVFLLLSGISCYSLRQSKRVDGLHFKDVFCHTFHSGWVYFILFVLLMVVLTNTWVNVCINWFDRKGIFFRMNRWDDIKQAVFWAPIWEEMGFRVLPYLIAVIPLMMIKSKSWRIVLGSFFILMILYVQMQFGFAHVSPFLEIDDDTVKLHIFNQGGTGVLFAITFGVVLYFFGRLFMQRQQTPNRFKAVLNAFPLAYLASCLLHGATNFFAIMTYVF